MAKKNNFESEHQPRNKKNSEEKAPEIKDAAPELTPLEAAEKQAAEYKDMALRSMAEFENYRRNNQNLSRDVKDRTVAEVLENILPVLDSFDRAREAIKDQSALEGLGLILGQLKTVLDKYGVSAIEAIGKDFDPKYHNCVMKVEKPEQVDKVVFEIQKGYMIGEKVLRHSVVGIGKAPEPQQSEEQNKEQNQTENTEASKANNDIE